MVRIGNFVVIEVVDQIVPENFIFARFLMPFLLAFLANLNIAVGAGEFIFRVVYFGLFLARLVFCFVHQRYLFFALLVGAPKLIDSFLGD